MPSPAECLNCSKCEGPCQQSPPAVSEYPSYGTPPPPAASPPPPSGYAIYGTPPPSPPYAQGQSKCPPAPGAPPFPYTISPPFPYTISPPNPYTYVPYGEGNSANSIPAYDAFLVLCFSFVNFAAVGLITV
ncbi:hypothetical protein L6164_029513 [Bauhinia variegata]|uniref:Uncharacterized protein n=1 Tax=Bauhinia variegata TaxID=167791 RepID=A0ACB9L8X2_BAUVA|nr:hypothetical protein L6164_029513 [Bauhinia variegata]